VLKKFLIFVILISLTFLFSACFFQDGRGDAGSDPEEPAEAPVPSADAEKPSQIQQPSPKPSPMPAPSAKPAPTEEERFKEILGGMTVEEKLGQLLIIGYSDAEHAETMIKEHNIGGFVLFSRSFDTFDQLYELTSKLRENNEEDPLPLWIALDEEGGTVTRLPSGRTPIPDARKVGGLDDPDLTETVGWVIGREMAAAGANLDFAPVVDIVDNPENAFMLKRSFGSTPEEVSRHAAAFLKGLHSTGVQGCAKHFPGHGGTAVDSHKDMPVLNASLEEWLAKDALPFQAVIDAGVEMVMAGHLAFPEIDPSELPASMSSVFLTDLLRDRMGFEGLIITDDIEMQGYPQGDDRKEAVITSFLAGIDLFAIGPSPQIQLEVLEALREGVESGRITEQRVDESLMRVIKAKMKLKVIPRYSLEEAREIFGSREHKEAVSRLFEN
jgi:beta-N-acetylhexosaminidase